MPPLFCGAAAVIEGFSCLSCSGLRSHSLGQFSDQLPPQTPCPNQVDLHRQHLSLHLGALFCLGDRMPPVPRWLRGSSGLLVLPVHAWIRLFLSPYGRKISLPVPFDQFLFCLPFEEFRFLAVIRAGPVPVRASVAGIGSAASECIHGYSPLFVVRGRNRTCLVRRLK